MIAPSQQTQVINELMAEIDSKSLCDALSPTLASVARLYASGIDPLTANRRIYDFMKHYISLCAPQMTALEKLGEQHKMQVLIEPYIKLASNYLINSCHQLESGKEASKEANKEVNKEEEKSADDSDLLEQFLTLLQGAYIYHRMIEELDDRIQHFIGVPLTHLDMMNANLIAHDIIGDKFANRLDQLIESMFTQAKITKTVIEAQLDRNQVELFRRAGKALSGEAVTCLAADHDLSLF